MLLEQIIITIVILYVIAYIIMAPSIDTKDPKYIFIWYYWYRKEGNNYIRQRFYKKLNKFKK